MSRKIEIAFQGNIMRIALHRVVRSKLYGAARRIGLDAKGRECASALLTRDGRHVLGQGSTAGVYLNEKGDVVAREALVRVDEYGQPVIGNKVEPGGSHELAGPVPTEALLECVVAAVYELDASDLDSTLASFLSRGDIYHLPDKGFLLANEHGVFLIAAEPVRFEFIGRDRRIAFEEDDDMDGKYDDLGFEIM